MNYKKKIISIIPARGGSKRLPGKNIKILAGKPLIAYSIEQSLKCDLINKTIVSTDDDEIAEIAKQYGADVIKRPKELAEDDSPTIDAVKHVLQNLRKEEYIPDAIILLQPTSLLRSIKDINEAINLFLETNKNVVSVTEDNCNWHLKIDSKNNNIVPLIDWNMFKKRKQDLPKTYKLNGSIYITITTKLFKNNSFFDEETQAFIMPEKRSIDIDTEFEFKLAELFLK